MCGFRGAMLKMKGDLCNHIDESIDIDTNKKKEGERDRRESKHRSTAAGVSGKKIKRIVEKV